MDRDTQSHKIVQIRSFSAHSNRIANVLFSQVKVSPAFDPRHIKRPPPFKTFHAIWDTGATGSCISKKVVDECGLKPTGMARVSTASRIELSQTYLVNLVLPNKVGIANTRVTEANLEGNIDALIGMDIINMGDFAVTNKDGKTTFSFRIPSIACIDFVKETQSKTVKQLPVKVPKVGRNAPCPCGSGKKYKHCCGK